MKNIERESAAKGYTTGFVTSKDGTKIGYRQLGNGPGLILVHGAMMASQNFMKLAQALSGHFTVYIPDRRRRGLSATANIGYGLTEEGEDIQAIAAKTKAQNIFGLSSGAIITIQTAIMEPAIKKIALYEPPVPVNGTKPAHWGDNYKSAMEEGNLAKAFLTCIKGTGDTSLFTLMVYILPGFIKNSFFNHLINSEKKEPGSDDVLLKLLIPTIHNDIRISNESKGIIEKLNKTDAEILLLGGTRSKRFLKIILNAFTAALPAAKRIDFKGLGHIAADNSSKPEVVAKELKRFFLIYPAIPLSRQSI